MRAAHLSCAPRSAPLERVRQQRVRRNPLPPAVARSVVELEVCARTGSKLRPTRLPAGALAESWNRTIFGIRNPAASRTESPEAHAPAQFGFERRTETPEAGWP